MAGKKRARSEDSEAAAPAKRVRKAAPKKEEVFGPDKGQIPYANFDVTKIVFTKDPSRPNDFHYISYLFADGPMPLKIKSPKDKYESGRDVWAGPADDEKDQSAREFFTLMPAIHKRCVDFFGVEGTASERKTTIDNDLPAHGPETAVCHFKWAEKRAEGAETVVSVCMMAAVTCVAKN